MIEFDLVSDKMILTELFDVVRLAVGIFLELLLQCHTIMLEKVLGSNDSVVVLFWCLQGLQGCEILPARVVEFGNGELGKLVLMCKCDARLRHWVGVRGKGAFLLGCVRLLAFFG